MINKTIRAAFCAAVFAFAVASPAAAEVVYNRGNTADPETLDQHKTSTVYEAHILRDLYEGLVIYDNKAQVVPGVATSWKVSDDGKIYTFKLRADAKWSNGDRLTANDFVYSYRRILNPETGAKYANILYPIKGAEDVNKGKMVAETLAVRAVDDVTLEITLNAATPYFLELLTHQTSLPIHQASVEKFGSDFVRPGNMVSNGAYILAEFVPNSVVKLVRNKNFHDAANVKIDTVNFYPTEDRGAALRRFQAGELLSNSDAPAEQIAFMKKELGSQFRIAPYLGTYYYAVKSDKVPLNDIRVRRALSMAVDREFLADEIMSNMLPGYSFVPPGIGNYGEPAYADYKDMSMIDREEEAKKLITAAGFSKDKPLEIEIRYNTSENHKNVAVAIADMWKQIGIKTSLLNTDTKTHYARLRDKGDFDVARAGWIGDYNDPQNFLFMVESDNDGFNYANYNNPEYDKLMDDAAVEVDLEKRALLLYNAEKLFMRDLPFIPLLYYTSMNLVSPKLKGFEDNIQNVHATRWMSIAQ
ncbi:MAG: peptide ABC transporter substrate-binding protein [Alphaproteobacteria bacterium]